MAALLVAMSVMAVFMTVALPVWNTQAQREKEAELVFRGEQYARAIMLYQRKFANALPPSLDVLLNDRYLRKKYKDPITGGDFQLLSGASAQANAGVPGGQVAGSSGPGWRRVRQHRAGRPRDHRRHDGHDGQRSAGLTRRRRPEAAGSRGTTGSSPGGFGSDRASASAPAAACRAASWASRAPAPTSRCASTTAAASTTSGPSCRCSGTSPRAVARKAPTRRAARGRGAQGRGVADARPRRRNRSGPAAAPVGPGSSPFRPPTGGGFAATAATAAASAAAALRSSPHRGRPAARAGWRGCRATGARGSSAARRRRRSPGSSQSDVPVNPVCPNGAGDIRVPHDDVGSIVSQPSARELPGTPPRRATNRRSDASANTPVRPSSTCSTWRAKAPTAGAVPKRPACPATPPSAAAFSSCTSPTSSRPPPRVLLGRRGSRPPLRRRQELQILAGRPSASTSRRIAAAAPRRARGRCRAG